MCGVKSHVLRYWEQEFTQLRPIKRRGNRRYYQHHEVIMVRRIRDLLYDQGFTVSGARNKLLEIGNTQTGKSIHEGLMLEAVKATDTVGPSLDDSGDFQDNPLLAASTDLPKDTLAQQCGGQVISDSSISFFDAD